MYQEGIRAMGPKWGVQIVQTKGFHKMEVNFVDAAG